MKIGIIAYNSVNNFGASLQLLSTYMFLKNKGHNPVVINWQPADLADSYTKNVNKEQQDVCLWFRKHYWTETERCTSSEDVANVIMNTGIEAVIIGSDAVAQHHPFFERIVFPSRKIISLRHPTSDRMFPNVFWGTFNDYLPQPVKVAVISASSQDSDYKYIWGKTKRAMSQRILAYSYISVRDQWTSDMISYLTDKQVIPTVTPDPVFAFNYNANKLVLSKEQIRERFNLPDNYYLLSFKTAKTVSQRWIDDFQEIAKSKNISCVSLPFSDTDTFGKCDYKIPYPISPIEWYSLIIHSQGYIGNNMHPIVVSIHNSIPFFSFDNYGLVSNNGQSSKVLHIITKADLLINRVSCIDSDFIPPTPNDVFLRLEKFEKEKAGAFAALYMDNYLEMMDAVLNSISK